MNKFAGFFLNIGLKYRIGAIVAVCLLCVVVFWILFLRSPNAETRYITVPQGELPEDMINRIMRGNYARNRYAFQIIRSLRGLDTVEAGGYVVPKGTNTWELVSLFLSSPQMIWVTIPEGFRKEQIAKRLAEKLDWSEKDIAEFLNTPAMLEYPVSDGIYFPDTYLINRDANGEQAAKIMINRFNEQLAPYQAELLKENIKWDTALKLASLVQREAAGNEDMPIIAAVLWNRLLIGMKLDVDATLQYALGNANNDYWPRISRENKEIDSPYNTYRVKGLPPSPIANPGTAALKAVIRPANTKCLYYLHDSEGIIHCTTTYEEHQDNIVRYLK